MVRGSLSISCVVILVIINLLSFSAMAADADESGPLVQLLTQKGVLTPEDAASLASVPPQKRHQALLTLLRDKGTITAAEFASLSPASSQVSSALVASVTPTALPLEPGKVEAPKVVTPKFIAAVPPVRVLQLEPSQPNGMIPDIKLGSGAKLKLYGMFKASVIYDSSSPLGTDMPLPGFFGDTGPGTASEFRAKARSARVGANFEWPDLSPKLALTGRIETDFEGDYTRVLNRNISSIRPANLPSAWVGCGSIASLARNPMHSPSLGKIGHPLVLPLCRICLRAQASDSASELCTNARPRLASDTVTTSEGITNFAFSPKSLWCFPPTAILQPMLAAS